MSHLGSPPPPPGSPGLWALADEDRLRGLLRDAGLQDARVEFLEGRAEYDGPEEWLATTARLAGPLRALFAALDDTARNAIAARVSEASEPYRRPDGRLALPERMLVARVIKP